MGSQSMHDCCMMSLCVCHMCIRCASECDVVVAAALLLQSNSMACSCSQCGSSCHPAHSAHCTT